MSSVPKILYLCSKNMEETIITSVQNARIKHVVALQQKSAQRRKEGLFVVEGRRELMHCLEAGYEIAECFVLDKQAELANLADLADQGIIFSVSPQVYEKMAYRGSTEGVIAVVRERQRSLEDLQLSASPLIILGAVLRSADAAKADAVIICDPLTDLYNPNLIRSSIGAIFSVPCVACSSEDCIVFLKALGIQILTAQLQDSSLYYDTDMLRGTAIVMGTESTGLTEVWRQAADAHIRIPMLGQLDSLNVSVSAAILLFEAVRQRNSKK